jgi:phosphoribosylanthranilate isomerase
MAAGATFVKICGITRLGDARAAIGAGANAVGFVFAPSPRRITAPRARTIARHVHPSVASVGVFVDAPLERILAIVDEVGLSGVQLQGDEPPQLVEALRRMRPALFIIKAIRASGPAPFGPWPDGPADAVMVDAKDPARAEIRSSPVPPAWLEGRRPRHLIVAGGLTRRNVGAVVAALRPWGVDVSSGVEEVPGRKDHREVSEFVQAVRVAEHRGVRGE